MNPTKNPSCRECGITVTTVPTFLEYQGQEIFVFDPVICQPCLEKLCENYSTVCANCGGTIPPYSNVGILKAGNGQNQFIHMTTQCNTPGNAFYGYWGKGIVREFVEIEACS
ncbi:MAG: hypothetical protein HOK41_08105 [Nitrospina sp.]|jgi:hypothetical protein|nr:hypothetical protein [Nitrospina sp.]